ncbi:MAG: hypothetical protein U9Q92_06480 [archaeon]|nr:hypothetical protein [archaeon]
MPHVAKNSKVHDIFDNPKYEKEETEFMNKHPYLARENTGHLPDEIRGMIEKLVLDHIEKSGSKKKYVFEEFRIYKLLTTGSHRVSYKSGCGHYTKGSEEYLTCASMKFDPKREEITSINGKPEIKKRVFFGCMYFGQANVAVLGDGTKIYRADALDLFELLPKETEVNGDVSIARAEFCMSHDDYLRSDPARKCSQCMEIHTLLEAQNHKYKKVDINALIKSKYDELRMSISEPDFEKEVDNFISMNIKQILSEEFEEIPTGYF